jgi:hypothetical protein
MRRPHFACLMTFGFLITFSAVTPISRAQQTSSETVPVKMIVSVEAKRGKEVPTVDHKEDIRAFEGKERLHVTDWVPLQGSRANLELLVLIDEAAALSVAGQFDDVRRFINAQPPTTAIAVGYMEYGSVRMAQNYTTDHDTAGKALHIPAGAAAGGNSPYLAITDAIKHWPESKARHTILLISDGIDALQPGISDSYLDQAVQTAQNTGTQIYSIYASRAGHFGHSLWRINQGQNNLSELTDKTGGESYFLGQGTPVSFAPFLNEFAERLSHQYLLTVLIKPDKKPSYRHVRLETEVPNVELVSADRVYVPAAK